ncbi:MAG: hypothetical protein H8E18_17150, partial [FCB group bacterium]|nr:hypothetical protein [FCB group bacterium]
KKKQEMANAQAIIHKVINGRYKPEQDAEEQRSKGKFFGDSGETPVRAGGISRDPPG